MQEGFFKKEEVQATFHHSKGRGRSLSCYTCGLYRYTDYPKLDPQGKFKKKIMVILGSPMEPNQYKSSFLQHSLKSNGIDLLKDCIIVNAINCIPKELPKSHELNCCRNVKVLPAIKKYEPKLILLFGTEAVVSIIGHRWKKDLGSINKWRGWQIPDKDFNAWVCPMYGPEFVRKKHNPVLTVIWKKDLKKAISVLDKPFPDFGELKIHYIEAKDLPEVKKGTVAIDYETTGLKPHLPSHKIVCTSVAVSVNEVYVFLMPKKKKHLRSYLNILINPKVKKLAHHLKFEDNWTVLKLKTQIVNWFRDAMLGIHIHDNRAGITSLKFLTYVYLGIVDYDSDISPYLKSSEKGGNSHNKILELLKTKETTKLLLKYNALDSIYEYQIITLLWNGNGN